ncbi:MULTISPECIES: hypothetical protein [unclassified Mesorhizobium]|uniref:hypothetical protein n=1 Tax=unclassified Mesorhizobium TaxID=325217 RepID=UPI003014669F
MNVAVKNIAAPVEIGEGAAPIPEDVLARFAQDASARDAGRDLPFDSVETLKKLRFGAYRLPKRAGGGGASLERSFAAALKLAKADSNSYLAQPLHADRAACRISDHRSLSAEASRVGQPGRADRPRWHRA